MSNDHYVQRALIRNWSGRLASGAFDSEVPVFDFDTARISKKSSRKLFAKQGLNAPEIESRLGQLIENPLSRFVQDDAQYRDKQHKVDGTRALQSRDVRRAVALSFAVQMARGLDGTGATNESLQQILTRSTKSLDAYAERLLETHQLATLGIPEPFNLFLPESGWFPFPVLDRAKFVEYELQQKLVFVAKKQTDNLERLATLFSDSTTSLSTKRVLFIDDEADAASVGYQSKKGIKEARSVSLQISNLRKSMPTSAYLQVTATPYALYLQPEEIEVGNSISFSPVRPAFTELVFVPDTYVGGETYFGEASRSEENTLEKLIHHEVDAAELTRLKSPDARSLKLETALTDPKIYSYRHALVNFVAGAAIQRINGSKAGKNPRKLLYSFLLHTEAGKDAHKWQTTLTESLIGQLNTAEPGQFEVLVKASYDDLSRSLALAKVPIPTLAEVVSASRALLNGQVKITKVNSDDDVMTLLDDTGQLQLRSPLNIFVGGQAIDRGVTIAGLIGFFYGRSPIKHQQDTVLQHSRMYGYRRDDLPVTRFYTSANIRQVMQNLEDFDSTLRKAIDLGKGKSGVQFIRSGGGCSNIVPCSPNKILISDVQSLGPHFRLTPVGFQTLKKTNEVSRGVTMEKRVAALDAEVERLVGFNTAKPAIISVDDAVKLLDLIEPTLTFEDEDAPEFNWMQAKSILHHLCAQSTDRAHHGKVLLWAANGRTVGRVASKESHTKYIATPDSKTEVALMKKFAIDSPMLLLLRQEGSNSPEKGWSGTPFYWPVTKTQAYTPFAVFVGTELD